MKDEAEAFRVAFLNAQANERAFENAKNRKMKYSSKYYLQAFINNYEDYYKNGGRDRNKQNDEIYSRITKQPPLKPIEKVKPIKRKNKK